MSDVEIFSGFKPAIEACYMDWQDYPIPGVTYGHNPKYMCPFTALERCSGAQTDAADAGRLGGGPVNSSPAVLRCEFPAGVSGHHPRPRSSGYRSRSQSENKPQGSREEDGAVAGQGWNINTHHWHYI